jgi:hypothetical protein
MTFDERLAELLLEARKAKAARAAAAAVLLASESVRTIEPRTGNLLQARLALHAKKDLEK